VAGWLTGVSAAGVFTLAGLLAGGWLAEVLETGASLPVALVDGRSGLLPELVTSLRVLLSPAALLGGVLGTEGNSPTNGLGLDGVLATAGGVLVPEVLAGVLLPAGVSPSVGLGLAAGSSLPEFAPALDGAGGGGGTVSQFGK
jgi:hypothetical protein